MTYEIYDEEMHRLFEAAFTIRCNTDSTVDELYAADAAIDDALSICSHMELETDNRDIQIEIINNRLRCYIERIAIYTRLMKAIYNTPCFDELSKKHEHYCHKYKSVYLHIDDSEVYHSQHQLSIMANQSLASNYFHRGGLGVDKELCQKAIEYIDKALELAKDDGHYSNILHSNKLRIVAAINNS